MLGEQLLGREDVGDGELAAVGGDLDVGVVDGGEAEQAGRVDEREQVVDLEDEVVRELGEVVLAAPRDEDLEQTRPARQRSPPGSGSSMGDG